MKDISLELWMMSKDFENKRNLAKKHAAGTIAEIECEMMKLFNEKNAEIEKMIEPNNIKKLENNNKNHSSNCQHTGVLNSKITNLSSTLEIVSVEKIETNDLQNELLNNKETLEMVPIKSSNRIRKVQRKSSNIQVLNSKLKAKEIRINCKKILSQLASNNSKRLRSKVLSLKYKLQTEKQEETCN